MFATLLCFEQHCFAKSGLLGKADSFSQNPKTLIWSQLKVLSFASGKTNFQAILNFSLAQTASRTIARTKFESTTGAALSFAVERFSWSNGLSVNSVCQTAGLPVVVIDLLQQVQRAVS